MIRMFCADGLLPYCMYQYDSALILQIGFFYLPLLVTITTGDVLFTIGSVEYMLRSRKHAPTADLSSPVDQKVPTVWVSPHNVKRFSLFAVAYVVFWLTMFIFRLGEMLIHDKLVRSFKAWIVCTFTNFDQSSPDSWRAVCGNSPKLKLSFSFTAWALLWLTCHSLLVAGVYLPFIWADSFCFKLTSSSKVGVLNSTEHADIIAVPIDMDSSVPDALDKA